MKRLDQKTARALSSLRKLPEFRVYREWLEQSLAETDKALRSAEGTNLARHQGTAQTLATQIEKIEESREIAEKFESKAG